MERSTHLPEGFPRSRKRGRLLLVTGAALLLAVLVFLTSSALMLSRLRDGDGGSIPNPVRMVKDWLFPPRDVIWINIMGVNNGGWIVDDGVIVPAAPPAPGGPVEHD